MLSIVISGPGMNESGFLNLIPAIYQRTGFWEFGYSLNVSSMQSTEMNIRKTEMIKGSGYQVACNPVGDAAEGIVEKQ